MQMQTWPATVGWLCLGCPGTTVVVSNQFTYLALVRTLRLCGGWGVIACSAQACTLIVFRVQCSCQRAKGTRSHVMTLISTISHPVQKEGFF